VVGNGVATLVVSRWEHELDPQQLRAALAQPDRGEHAKSENDIQGGAS
jgi:Na+/H+-dicarboxylate symporter